MNILLMYEMYESFGHRLFIYKLLSTMYISPNSTSNNSIS